MIEGTDYDDSFRMVEDELLDAAKQFTQHLHAAEYQRLKKAARSHNAEAISSISRPVSIRMPDETRRKVEGVSRSRRQASGLKSLLENEGSIAVSDNDSDEGQGAWVGTALHGLMISPRKKNASLARLGAITNTTRAAAGFQRSRSPIVSPKPPLTAQNLSNRRLSTPTRIKLVTDAASSNSGEDLDASVLPVELLSRGCRSPLKTASTEELRGKSIPHIPSHPSMSLQNELPETFDELPSRAAKRLVSNHTGQMATDSKARIAKRLEQSRAHKIKEEKEARKKRLDDIPTFL
jgi:hypothetical protein